MGKQVIWSEHFISDIEEVLKYWNYHNSNDAYSTKLLSEIIESEELIPIVI